MAWLFLHRWQANGEHSAAVFERATKHRLTSDRGAEGYARRASLLFAKSGEARMERLAQTTVPR